MKNLEIFYRKDCPYCKKAFRFIEALQDENDLYRTIKPKLVDEEIEVDYADMFDYYYVPTFYIDGKKVHEGAIGKEELKNILEQTLG